MPLSSLLRTIKINGSELTAACLWVTRDYQRISGQSRMITIWMTDLAYRTWADDDVGAVNDVHSWIARPLFKPMLRPIWRNLASYRFRDIRGQNLGSCGPLGVALNQGETVSWTHICRHVKFHADRCQCRRDICNRTDTQRFNYSRFNSRQNAYERCACQ